MNKKLFLSALASTALLASCVENDLGSNEDLSANSNGDGRIGFNYKVGNMTRATELAQNAGHYEFGVYAFKGATAGNTTESVMDNYLVAYGNTTNLYKDLKDQASTWGDNTGGDYTDVENKVSSWFYEGIGKTAVSSGDGLTWGNTGYTVPDANQVLKYWDKNQNVHDYYAFMPYATKGTAVGTMNPTQVTYASNALTFTGINAFATSTESKLNDASPYQVSGARAKEKESAAASQSVIPNADSKPYTEFNKELRNFNEGLYAYQSVSLANYDKDVELTFKHINAKVNVAFYEDIKGYKVELINLVPENTPAPGDNPSGTRKYLTAASGVQFSPATLLQAEEPMATGHPQPSELPTYNSAATITVSNLNTTPVIAHTDGTEITKNLVFEATNNASAETYTGSGVSRTYIGESRASKTVSATTLYPLAIYDDNTHKYITKAKSQNFQTSSFITTKTTSSNIGDVTGYTLHVSYKMIPLDGSADITIYDARVHVAAEYCRWEAGKAYTYIFKITDRANGVTDPTKVDPAGSGTDPWIDPTDPRVPDDPVLTPIVFDGVTVTNYEDVNTGKENDVDEWVIADPDTWTFFILGGSGTTKAYYDNSGVYGKTAVTDVLNRFNIAASPITSVQWNGTAFNVQLNDGGSTPTVFKASSYVNETKTKTAWEGSSPAVSFTFAGGTPTEVSDLVLSTTEITIAKPAFNVWSSETEAVPYIAVPTAIELTPYDVVYKVTGTDVEGAASKIYETGKKITKAEYDEIISHDAAQKSQITITAKFTPTVTYQTATNITPGTASTAKSAYLIVTKK